MKNKPICVEIPIQADIDDVWEFTQIPELHQHLSNHHFKDR
ncbi:hypothetical protein ACQKM9_08830 [Viridibacillus sp. NPDC093762]